MYVDPQMQCLLHLSDHNQIWVFSTYFSKIRQNNIKKICPAGTELLIADRQDRRNEANGRFSQHCEGA